MDDKNDKVRKENKKRLETQQRVDFIIELIAKGLTQTKDICRFVTEKYEVSQRQAERYLQEAKDEIKKYSDKDRELNIGMAIMRLNYLYNKSIAIQDYRECRGVIADIRKIQGLDAPVKKDINKKVEKTGKPKAKVIVHKHYGAKDKPKSKK